MPTTPNVFQELQAALEEFKAFLTDNSAKIRTLVAALIDLFPEIVKLIDELIELLGKLEIAIMNLKLPQGIDNLEEVAVFAKKVETLVNATKALLPPGDSAANEVLDAIGFVASIPGITTTVKEDIIKLIGEVVDLLDSLKPA